MLVLVALASVGTPAVASPSWTAYVEAPPSRIVQPVSVLSTTGDVRNAGALTSPSGDDVATMTYSLGGTTPTIVLDYGKEIGGYASFDVSSTSGTPTLRAAYSETLRNLSADGDFTSQFTPQNTRFDTIPATVPGEFTGANLQGGERYELLTLTTPGTLTLRSVSIHFTGVLGTPDALRGYFASSDDLLNRIWYAGVYTVNLNQLVPNTGPPNSTNGNRRLLLDGAKRDRSVWSGDVAISGKTVYAALDPGYVRDSLHLIGEYPATLADYLVPAVGVQSQPGPLAAVCQPNNQTPACLGYSMSYSTIFVMALWDYFLHTADREFVAEEWPNVTRVLAWDAQQADSNGLLVTDSNNGRDWHGTGPALTGEVTWNNVIYYESLNDAADMADALGQTAFATSYRVTATSVKNAINTRLWNESTGVYDISDSIRGAVAQDANVFAINAGIASPDQTTRILSVLNTKLVHERGMLGYAMPVPSGLVENVSPFMGSYHVFADFEARESTAALDLIRKEWGYQIGHDPGGTTWEAIPVTGELAGSESAAHAWGSGPTAALTQYVVGVAPTSPGFATFTIEPQPGDLSWARGRVPTPHGAVDVDWSSSKCTFALTTTVPPGTIASVTLPGTQGTHSASVDGNTRTRRDATSDFEITGIQPGTHQLTGRLSRCA